MQDLLRAFDAHSADIQASAIFSLDGVILASTLPNEEEGDEVGAMSAALHAIASQGAILLKRGELQQIQINYSEGNVILSPLGRGFVLVSLTKKQPNIGLLLHEIKRLRSEIPDLEIPDFNR